MTRKFKTASVLVAVVAMFALTASSASATFTSSLTENSGTGTSTGEVFDLFSSIMSCTEDSFHVGKYDSTKVKTPGKHEEALFPTNTLTVVPTYNKCTAFGLPATINSTGCDYVFHTTLSLTVDLVCPSNASGMDITVFSSGAHTSVLCHFEIHPFIGKGGLTAANNGEHVNVKGSVANITATQVRNSIACPAGTHTSNAKYTVQEAGITIKGTQGSALSVS